MSIKKLTQEKVLVLPCVQKNRKIMILCNYHKIDKVTPAKKKQGHNHGSTTGTPKSDLRTYTECCKIIAKLVLIFKKKKF